MRFLIFLLLLSSCGGGANSIEKNSYKTQKPIILKASPGAPASSQTTRDTNFQLPYTLTAEGPSYTQPASATLTFGNYGVCHYEAAYVTTFTQYLVSCTGFRDGDLVKNGTVITLTSTDSVYDTEVTWVQDNEEMRVQ